jgi:hypothetical protein
VAAFDMQRLEGRSWAWRGEEREPFRGGFVRVQDGQLEWTLVTPEERGGLQPGLLRQTAEAFLAAGPPVLGRDSPDRDTVEAIRRALLAVRREQEEAAGPATP